MKLSDRNFESDQFLPDQPHGNFAVALVVTAFVCGLVGFIAGAAAGYFAWT